MPDLKSTRPFKPFRPEVVLGLLTLFFIALIYVTLFSRERALNDLQIEADNDLSRYRIALEQKIERYRNLPELLSNHNLLVQAVLGANEPQLASANLFLQKAAQLVNALDIYVMDTEGVTRAASNWFKDTSFIQRNFSFRPYFTDAMKGLSGRYFALGSTTKKRGYYFSYPMTRDEAIIGVVVVKIDLDQIEGNWSDPDTDMMVVDEDGIIVISTQPQWMFKSLARLSSAQMQRIVDSQRYGDQPLNSLNIVNRQPIKGNPFSDIITVLEVSETDGDFEPSQYLTRQNSVSGTGLSVRVLANLKPVDDRVFLIQAMLSIGCVLLVLSVMVALQRRRIHLERVNFERREARVRREQEERIEGVINNTQVGLSLIDLEGRIEYFNPVLEKLFGYSLGEMLGQPFDALLSPEDRLLLKRYVELELSTREQNLKLEVDCIASDGRQFPVEITLSNMMQSNRYHLIVTLVDITERREHLSALARARNTLEQRVEERTSDLKAAYDQLRTEVEDHQKTQNELVQAAKLATIGQMSAGINHELNQPLTAIRHYADNAAKFLSLGKIDRTEKNLEQIARLTERMARIIHPLKEFSRKEDEQQSVVSLRDIRDGAMSIMYGQLARMGIKIQWPSELETIWLKADLLRLEQVMVNLINNAAQAMENSAVKLITVEVAEEEHRVVLSVCDTGPGIREEALDHVFAPFYTTKEQGQGLGLGLSISQRIISSLGGQLTSHNRPEGGAEFRIELPKAPHISSGNSSQQDKD